MTELSRVEQILKKLGIQYEDGHSDRLWALCPFHEDHKPSWFIRYRGEHEGQHHCFTCKAGGGLVDLVMKMRGYVAPSSAIEWLKNFKEAPPPPVAAVSLQVQSPTKKPFKLSRAVRFEPLEKWPTLARRYAEQRGFAFQIERHRIGYAVEGRLEGRIVFVVWQGAPYMDLETWTPVSYQARTFIDHELRYYFPNEDENPNLDIMFGACHFPVPGLRRRSRVHVTEGAINALAVERILPPRPDRGSAGHYACALGASDVREAHLNTLATFGEVVLVTDNDKAGNAAADSLYYSLARHTKVARVKFPPKEDPASVPVEICRAIISSARPS